MIALHVFVERTSGEVFIQVRGYRSVMCEVLTNTAARELIYHLREAVRRSELYAATGKVPKRLSLFDQKRPLSAPPGSEFIGTVTITPVDKEKWHA